MSRFTCHPRSGLGAALLAFALVCGCGGNESPTAPSPGNPPPPTPAPAIVLASIDLVVPAALDRGEPGEHEPFVIVQRVRPDLTAASGRHLTLTLRDAGRPGLVCPSERPEDGCATVDWSGDPALPGVPAGGRFENRLTLELVSGAKTYFLSRTFRLADVPDVIDPNRRHTSVGGAERRWEAVLPTDLVAGSTIELRLVMTKWQLPAVRIRMQLELRPGA